MEAAERNIYVLYARPRLQSLHFCVKERMPAKYLWVWLGEQPSDSALDKQLDTMKTYSTFTSHKVRCQICAIKVDNHHMRYKVLLCNSRTCGEGCEWAVKGLTCCNTQISELFQHRFHASLERSPPRKKMKLTQKHFVKDMTKLGARPARIHSNMTLRYPNATAADLPSLCQVQRVSYHYRKTVLMDDELVSTMNSDQAKRLLHRTISRVYAVCVWMHGQRRGSSTSG